MESDEPIRGFEVFHYFLIVFQSREILLDAQVLVVIFSRSLQERYANWHGFETF